MITIRELSEQYDGHAALRDVNLDVPDGSVTAIIGPSGSGKTTLLRLLDLLEQPDAGSIAFEGAEAPQTEAARLAMRRRIGIVFQKPVAFSGSVLDNVSYGLRVRGHDRRSIRERVGRALDTVDLAGYENRNARTLSGGEIQRVAPGAPLAAVIYSHQDADHATGAPALMREMGREVEILAHRNAVAPLRTAADPDLPVPTTTYQEFLSIAPGGRRIELHYVGANHTDNSTVVFVPDVAVAFAVDFVAHDRAGFQELAGKGEDAGA